MSGSSDTVSMRHEVPPRILFSDHNRSPSDVSSYDSAPAKMISSLYTNVPSSSESSDDDVAPLLTSTETLASTHPRLRLYKRIKCLSRSTVSSVHLAKSVESNEHVILKSYSVSSNSLSNSLIVEKMMMNEIEVQKNLSHPNIVKLIDHFDDARTKKRYLVLEYVENGPLASDSVTSMKPLDATTAWSYFVDLVSALNYLHQNNIVHRDVKPSNLLITSNNSLKLSDFGVSKDVESGRQSTAALTGSSAFLSPEVISGYVARSSSAADVWAAGVTLYFMLFGVLPFYDDQVYRLYGKICRSEPKFPYFLDPLIKDLLCTMLDKSPKNRISAQQLQLHPWVKLGPLTDSPIITNEIQLANREAVLEQTDGFSHHSCSVTCIHHLLPAVFKSQQRASMVSIASEDEIEGLFDEKGASDSKFDFRKIMAEDSEADHVDHNWSYLTESHSEGNYSSTSNYGF
ncbi:hypothetical protein GEMRC1_010707 [Eukaryota sp. GEM-RC1]